MNQSGFLHSDLLHWRGLLAEESRRPRIILFLILLVTVASMTYVQCGFVGIGHGGRYSGYALALLAPIAIAALLLGKEWGTLLGLASGVILYAHAQWQPLDLIERYFVTPYTSIVLYAATGLLLGILFSLALHRNPTGWRRVVPLTLICAFMSFATSEFFHQFMDISTLEHALAFLQTGSPAVQIVVDFVLMIVVTLATDFLVKRYYETHLHMSVRTIFRMHMTIALLLVYCLTSAVSFTIITVQEELNAHMHMIDELEYITEQVKHNWDALDQVIEDETYLEIKDEHLEPILSTLLSEEVIAGYDMGDGIVAIFEDDTVLYSDCYEQYVTVADIFGDEMAGVIDELAASQEMRQFVYEDGSDLLQLGYMCAMPIDEDANAMMAMPAPMVFDERSNTMHWTSFSTFLLLAVVYVLAAQLLKRVMVDPIDHTNKSLDKIMQGNLDEQVREVGSIEFASLSAGINATVFALKEYAAEAAHRIERDLATARAIQISSLPRTFPAFPGNDAVDLYASMDPAREVGGDFYDFFEVDDHTVGFLIADVSGKGIPASLFMMAAKSEIANRMGVGMDLVEAIAGTNRYLCEHNEAGMFVTVWAATLDWETGELTYVNAGHNYPLLRHGRGGTWTWLTKKCGLFLGTFETARYRKETLVLEPGDELVLYTDGVNEAFDVHENGYGNQRLEDFLESHADLRPQELVQALRADVASWAQGTEQSDDVTIMAVEYR